MKLHLIRKNKHFEGFEPIVFEKEANLNKKVFEIKDPLYWYGPAVIADRFSLAYDYSASRNKGGVVTSIGVLAGEYKNGIIAIALRKEGKLSIYCNEHYFELNPAKKKYINKYAKDNDLSVRKDIHYIEANLLNTWLQPIEVNMSFYDENIQKQNSKELIEKLKLRFNQENNG